MNQHSRQKAKNSVKKNFLKLLNSSNFRYDCQNNLDTCTFVSIFAELNEATYLKKILSHYDQKISKFVSNDLTKQDAEEQYNDAV